MNACDSCPNRWMADLFEALGSTEKAAEIREAGCGWWWSIYVENDNGNPEPVQVCGAEHLPSALNWMGREVKLASETIQEDRNEQARALEKVDGAIEEYGLGQALQAVSELGLRAVIARQVTTGSGDDKQESQG